MLIAAALLWSRAAAAQTPATAPGASGFPWPEGARAAVSLTFDDARPSQVDVGLPIFDRHAVKVTLFLVPSTAEQRRAGWKKAAVAGHEIGEPGVQTTRVGLLEKLLPYLRDPANGFWTAPMGTVAHAIRRVRAGKEERP